MLYIFPPPVVSLTCLCLLQLLGSIPVQSILGKGRTLSTAPHFLFLFLCSWDSPRATQALHSFCLVGSWLPPPLFLGPTLVGLPAPVSCTLTLTGVVSHLPPLCVVLGIDPIWTYACLCIQVHRRATCATAQNSVYLYTYFVLYLFVFVLFSCLVLGTGPLPPGIALFWPGGFRLPSFPFFLWVPLL